MRMELILQGRDVWDVIDPSTEGVPRPTTPGQQLDDWVQRDKKALTQIKCYVSDTALLSLCNKVTACNTWKALSDHYNSVRAQDAENGKNTQGGNSSVDYSASLEGQSNERGLVLRQLATWLLQVQ